MRALVDLRTRGMLQAATVCTAAGTALQAVAQPAARSVRPAADGISMGLGVGIALALLAITGTGLAIAVARARRAPRPLLPPQKLPRRASADTGYTAPDFAETHQAPDSPDVPGGPPPRPAAAEAVRRLGPYRVERDIGRGAMGMVLLCRDERSGEPAALKTLALSQEFDGEALDEARQRFFREAETAGRLQHPDIVAVREAGEDQGVVYIAMELLGGHDLSEHTRPDQRLPVKDVLEIGARVARALAYAHRQGVTHRDIKPANIMVDPLSGTVKVTDFGIARIIDSTQTRTGLVLGTPSFMSPEQMAGARIDGRSDLYSLGVTLFQLLTGRLPHQGGSMSSLVRAIANDPAPDVRTLRPDLPQALADVLALALGKHPDRRYANGDAMADDLRAVAAMLAAMPVASARPPEPAGPGMRVEAAPPQPAHHQPPPPSR